VKLGVLVPWWQEKAIATEAHRNIKSINLYHE